MTFRYKIIAFLLCMLAAASAFAAQLPASPPDYVVDLAGIVDAGTRSKLDGYLAELERKTGAQVIVLTVDTIDGADIDGYSLQVAERWKLGQKGKDNGLLILFAMKERKYRFEVGYGLEGILPDSAVGSIGREYIVPAFRRGDYPSGVAQATLAAATVIAKNAGVEITGMPVREISTRPPEIRRRAGPAQLIFMALMGIVMLYLFIRHPRLFILMLLMSGGGRRGGWDGGGGGGGGFGGGGGGGFGGGGASGGW